MLRHLTRVVAGMGLAASLAVPGGVGAQTIFTNFTSGFGYNTTAGNPVGFDFFGGDNDAEGISFIPGFTSSLVSVQIALSSAFSSTNANPVTVALRTNSGGLPAAAFLEAWLIGPASLGMFGNANAPVFLASIINPILSSGTKYWLTVAGSPTEGIAWNLNNSGDANPTATSVDGGVTWNNLGLTPGAAQLSGQPMTAVPEPATLTLVATGFVGIAGFARRVRPPRSTPGLRPSRRVGRLAGNSS